MVAGGGGAIETVASPRLDTQVEEEERERKKERVCVCVGWKRSGVPQDNTRCESREQGHRGIRWSIGLREEEKLQKIIITRVAGGGGKSGGQRSWAGSEAGGLFFFCLTLWLGAGATWPHRMVVHVVGHLMECLLLVPYFAIAQ